jgi:predicted DNA-binding protein
MISVTDHQRQVLDELSVRTGRSTAELIRDAIDAWMTGLSSEEVAQAS